MILTLNPEHERMVNEEIQAGHYRNAEEVIGSALEALREKRQGFLRRAEQRDPKRAAARIRERRKGVTLGGLRIKDLVDEGRR
jgi:Arc/MetJ-type ribon-helix-helix transcriptional regulator